MKFIIVAGHVGIDHARADGLCEGRDLALLRRGTGSRGEMAWTGDAAQRVAAGLRALGHDAIATDASGGDDVRAPADLVVQLHYQRDRDTTRAFAATPDQADDYITPDAEARSQRWVDLFVSLYARRTGIPVTQAAASGGNLIDHYLWCYVDSSSACVIVEVGHADLDATTLYEPGMVRVVGALVEISAVWSGGGVALPVPPPAPTPVTATVIGATRATRENLIRYLWSGNPRASIAVPSLYATLAPLAGVRAEVAFAQAMHETGFLTFPRIARPEWHNFAGLGCGETSRTCNMWSTDEEGVRAHLGHLLVYFGTHAPAFCDLDQRHTTHRSLPNAVTELGGAGRWAPSPDYGFAVARKSDAVLAA